MIEHDHCTCSGSLRQGQAAFCDKEITILVIGNGFEPFIDFKGYSCIEFDIFLNGVEKIGSAVSLEFMNILIGTLDKGLILVVVIQQPDIRMLGDGHVMDEVQGSTEKEHGFVKISGFPETKGTGIVLSCQSHGVFPAIQALLPIWVVKMMGALKILVCPYCTFIDVGNIAQEKVVFFCMLVIPKNLQRLDIDEFMDLTLGFHDGFLDWIGNSKYSLQKVIV